MSELRLRTYQPADWEDVCRIHDAARVQELAAGNVDPRAFKSMVEAAEADEFFVSQVVVACLTNMVAGFIAWHGSYITWLYVDPPFQHQGIGSKLLSHAIEQIGPTAWTSMIGGNEPALQLYLRAGLEVVWERPGSCDGFPCRAMRLALPTSPMRDPDRKRTK